MKKKPDAPPLDLRHPALSESRPHFVDNRNGNTLDVAFIQHLQALRAGNMLPWGASIATGFFDVPGFNLLADDLGRRPRPPPPGAGGPPEAVAAPPGPAIRPNPSSLAAASPRPSASSTTDSATAAISSPSTPPPTPP